MNQHYAFCRRWRDMGGKVYVDVDTPLEHLGQMAYHGNLFESLRAQGRW